MPSKTTADFRERHGPFAMAALHIHNNNSTKAYELIARYYGLSSHTKVFEAIQVIHSEEMEMFEELDSIRRKWAKYLRNWIDRHVKEEHPDEYAQLRGLV